MFTKSLTCSCCGGDAGKFEQHPNRDAGYGICRKCVDWLDVRGVEQDEFKRNYGTEGVNYAKKEAKS